MSTADATLRMILLGEDRSASKALGTASGAAQKAEGHFHSLGKVAASVFAGGALIEGAQKAAEVLKGSVDAAMQDQQANAILERQLKNTTGTTHEQAKAVEEWITKAAEASGTAKSDLTPSLTKLATVTGSVSKAQRLTTLAMNVAAGTHQKLTSVVGAFVKAQNGSIGGLSRLGIATKNADGSTKTFAQTQKIMAAQFKGATAAAADTAAGKMKRLGVTWEEMKVQIGDKLLPVLADLAGFFLDKVMPAVSKLGSYLSTKLTPFFTSVADVVKKATSGMNGDTSKNLGAMLATFHSIVDIVTTLWKRFGGFITTYLVSTFKNVIQILGGVFKVIEGVFKVFDSLIHGDWKGVWDGIKMILSGVLTIIKGLLKQGLNSLKLIWSVGWSILKSLLGKVWDGIKALALLEVNGLLTILKGIPSGIIKLGGLMLTAGKTLMGKFFEGLKHVVTGTLPSLGASVMNGLISILNGIITAINNAIPDKIAIPAAPDINLPDNPIPSIPHFATGVRNFRGGYAMVGERGSEIVGLPPGSNVYPHGTGPGGMALIVNFNGLVTDPRAAGQAVVQAVNNYYRTSGKVAALLPS